VLKESPVMISKKPSNDMKVENGGLLGKK